MWFDHETKQLIVILCSLQWECFCLIRFVRDAMSEVGVLLSECFQWSELDQLIVGIHNSHNNC